jgi:transporter family protein
MARWILFSTVVIVLWGVVGLLQKIGSNRMSAKGLIFWTTIGYLVLIPFLLHTASLGSARPRDLFVGIGGGLLNGLGALALYASMGCGAKASVVVPLTALNPVLTILLAITLLHERLTGFQWIGIALAVLAGVLLSWETAPSELGEGGARR